MKAESRAGALALLLLCGWAMAQTAGDPTLGALSERAEAGDAAAQFELAVRHSRGDGVAADPDAAGRWLVRAAEGGHVEARAALGLGLLERATTPEEKQVALEWLRAAAESGHTTARLLLGREALDAGRGAEAVAHFAIVAEEGDPEVQYALGLIHHNGEGVPADPLEALHWLRRAALQGHSGGQRGLGALLANGHAGPVDLDAGYFWFTLAAETDTAAADYVDALARELDSAQREALHAMASDWRRGDPGPVPRRAHGAIEWRTLPDPSAAGDCASCGPNDASSESDEPAPIERWPLRWASAVRRDALATDGGAYELLVCRHEPTNPALWRWLGEGASQTPVDCLSLLLSAEVHTIGGYLRSAGGWVEMPPDAIDADLRVRHGWLGGRLRASPGVETASFETLDLRVLVELQPGGR